MNCESRKPFDNFRLDWMLDKSDPISKLEFDEYFYDANDRVRVGESICDLRGYHQHSKHEYKCRDCGKELFIRYQTKWDIIRQIWPVFVIGGAYVVIMSTVIKLYWH